MNIRNAGELCKDNLKRLIAHHAINNTKIEKVLVKKRNKNHTHRRKKWKEFTGMEDKAVYFDELKKFGGPMGEKGGNGTSDEYF